MCPIRDNSWTVFRIRVISIARGQFLCYAVRMAKKRIDRDKITGAFLACAFEKSAGAVSLADIAARLDINKASLYNHFKSRDEIYEATLDFAARYMAGVSFIAEPLDTLRPLSFSDALAKVIRHYFRSYEIEPLFQMFTLVHSCKFFSERAMEAAANETQKIADGVTRLLEICADGTPRQAQTPLRMTAMRHVERSETSRERALFFAESLCSALETHVAGKKATMRKNPETGAGSLFALPSDGDTNEIVARAILYWDNQKSENRNQ